MCILNQDGDGQGDQPESQRDSVTDCFELKNYSQGLQIASSPPNILQTARLHLLRLGGASLVRQNAIAGRMGFGMSQLWKTFMTPEYQIGNQIASLRKWLTLVAPGEWNPWWLTAGERLFSFSVGLLSKTRTHSLLLLTSLPEDRTPKARARPDNFL